MSPTEDRESASINATALSRMIESIFSADFLYIAQTSNDARTRAKICSKNGTFLSLPHVVFRPRVPVAVIAFDIDDTIDSTTGLAISYSRLLFIKETQCSGRCTSSS